jgi:D-inositol-3-phosphate glycosyltransferase
LQYHAADVKPLFFRAADVIVLPYREIYSSGVLVNTMKYGTPMIVSDKPLFREFLSDGHDCLMFENENASSLTEALTKAFAQRDTLQGLATRATETFNRTFDADIAAERTIAVYRRFVS